MRTAIIALVLSVSPGTVFAAASQRPGKSIDSGLKLQDPTQYQSFPLADPPIRGLLPARVDLTGQFAHVGNSPSPTSSAAWAVATLKTFLEVQERGWDADTHQFSAAFIYNQLVRGKSCREEIALPAALELVARLGAVPTSVFGADVRDCRTKPNTAALKAANEFRIRFWSRVDFAKEAAVKSELVAGQAVLAAIQIDDAFQGLTGDAIYSHAAERPTQAVAIVVVGYDDNKGAFRVLSSWGNSWGDHGYSWIGYDTFKAAAKEAYIAQDALRHHPARDVSRTSTQLPRTVTFDGHREFAGDIVVAAKTIIFKHGAVVRVRNGASLELRGDEIIVEGRAAIDGTGERGIPGKSGRSAAIVEWTSQGEQDFSAKRSKIERDTGAPERGGAGGDGSIGGHGARIVLSEPPLAGTLDVNLQGGPGGPPGRGGLGTLLVNAADPTCAGCMIAFDGPLGHPGRPGADGKEVFLTDVASKAE